MKETPKLLFVLGMAMMFSLEVANADISFATAVTISGDADIEMAGALVQATSFGTSQTVNGVTFAASGTPTTGQFTIAFPGGSVNASAFTSGEAPFSGLSSAYRGMLQGAAFGNADGGGGTVTLTGLTTDQEYLVQLFVSDPRGLARSSEVNSGSSTQGVDYNVGDVDGGLGQFVVGTFTATAASEVINMTPTNTVGSQSVQVNAIQLRALPVMVTNTNDSGPGSLREAIAAAAANGIIDFDPSLADATIELTSGPLLIDKPLTFDATPVDGPPVAEQLRIRLNTAGQQDAFNITTDPANVSGLDEFEIDGRPPKTSYGNFMNLTATDGEAGDGFGDAMAQSGNQLLVGAPAEDGDGNAAADSGAAYVFTPEQVIEVVGLETPIVRFEWEQRAVFRADNAEADDAFGSAVAVDRGIAVVGAPGEDGPANGTADAGAAYVFARDEAGVWARLATLRASTPTASARFGSGVAILDNRIAVGAPGDDTTYLFERTGTSWTQTAAVTPSNGGFGGYEFGAAMALTADTLIVGAPSENSDATGIDGDGNNIDAIDSGAVYLFAPDINGTWTEQHFIKSDRTNAGDNFGHALAVSDGQLAVGAPSDDGEGGGLPDTGAVFFYDLSGAPPVLTDSIKAERPGANDGFGNSLALGSGRLLVGAPDEDSAAGGFDGDAADNSLADSGAVYLYENSYGFWRQRTYAKAAIPAASQRFGRAVELASDTAFASVGGEVQPFDHLSQYTFVRPPVSVDRGNQFGAAVAISGDTFVVSELGHRPNPVIMRPLLHIYQRDGNGWQRQQTVQSPVSDNTGERVAIEGDTIIAGAITAEHTGAALGEAKVFTRSGGVWSQSQALHVPGVRGQGAAVAIAGDRVAVGCRARQIQDEPDSANTFIYTRTVGGDFTHTHTLPPPPLDGPTGRLEVLSIAMSGDKVVVASRDFTIQSLGPVTLQLFDLASATPEIPQDNVDLGRLSSLRLGVGDHIEMEGDTLAVISERVLRIYRCVDNQLVQEELLFLPAWQQTELEYGLSLSKAGLILGSPDGALHYLPQPNAEGGRDWVLQRRFQPRHDFDDNVRYHMAFADDGTIVAATSHHTVDPADHIGINGPEGSNFPTSPNDAEGAAFIFERPGGRITLEDDSGIALAPGSALVFSSEAIERTFTLRNCSAYPLVLDSPAITGADAGLFELVTPPAGMLAPNASTTFTLRFSPSANSTANARLELQTNSADSDVFTVSLSADPDFDLLWPTDSDGDGSPFGVEIALGTDPDSPDPGDPRHPSLTPSRAGDDVTITFGHNPAAPDGTSWVLTRSTDLVTFEEIFRFDGTTTVTNEPGNTVSITADQFQVTDTTPPSPRAFYRFQAEYIAP